MNVLPFADVNNHSLASVWQFRHGHGLSFSKFGPVAFRWLRLLRFKVGQLNPVKREVALTPFLTPIGNHQREQVAVLIRARRIAFALIPNGTTDGVT